MAALQSSWPHMVQYVTRNSKRSQFSRYQSIVTKENSPMMSSKSSDCHRKQYKILLHFTGEKRRAQKVKAEAKAGSNTVSEELTIVCLALGHFGFNEGPRVRATSVLIGENDRTDHPNSSVAIVNFRWKPNTNNIQTHRKHNERTR